MTPKKALEILWNDGFFKKIKSQKEIEQAIYTRWKRTPSKLIMNLKLKSVKKFLIKKPKGWIQRHPFIKKEEGIQVYYFEPEKPRTSRKDFKKVLNELKGEIKICDPYLNKDTLEALEELKNAKVKFLTSSKKTNIRVSNQEPKDFKDEYKNIEIKGFPFDYLHDRYILSNKKLLLLGHGFSIRKKESFIIELPEKFSKDIIQSLSATFDSRWKNPNNTIL